MKNKTFEERRDDIGSCCSDGCEGRCRECPDDFIRDLFEEINRLKALLSNYTFTDSCNKTLEAMFERYRESQMALRRCKNIMESAIHDPSFKGEVLLPNLSKDRSS